MLVAPGSIPSAQDCFCCSAVRQRQEPSRQRQEKIDLSRDLAKRITASASNNLRQAICSYEATWKAKMGRGHLQCSQKYHGGAKPKAHLVAELKRDKDEEFQHNSDELALDLNHCRDCKLLKKCKECKSREATLKMRNMNIGGFAKEPHDHGETIRCFIKIEEFTVRFMRFYRSLIAKNSKRGGTL